MSAVYEKLGAFYLGRGYDLEKGERRQELLLYDAKDLTTHGVCVGMTGSGKTGLCISLLEEAAIDGIPAIAIDPKGDLGNLMLTFPELRPEDFRPWIDEDAARRQGQTLDEHAAATARMWRDGLADWDQDGARIARLRAAAEVTIFTPGSRAGVPIRALQSFAPPAPELMADDEALGDRIEGSVSGLLALLGEAADPLSSRQHILLSNLLGAAWREGRTLDLAALIRGVQDPPFDKLGVLDLESFFPRKERFELAMRINGVLASPSFATWLEGEPLDIGSLLYTPEGRPRLSILSIAHLGDAERMFFVTLLLNEILIWVRSQPGTSSLRALLYMDEIFGFFPPVANPPSKKPMLTLLKQARAYGLGVLLATQNPVDLDYKGLANTGTWFLGRLQTERDKQRVLDGLQSVTASSGSGFDRQQIDAALSSLQSRVFLLHNVHEDGPEVFHTRWAMSYLRGPLTRAQIGTLMADRKSATEPSSAANDAPAESGPDGEAEERPVLPPGVDEYFLTPTQAAGDRHRLLYRARLGAEAKLHFVSSPANVDTVLPLTLLAPLPDDDGHVDWDAIEPLADQSLPSSGKDPASCEFGHLPGSAARADNHGRWRKELRQHLYLTERRTVWSCEALDEVSKLGESEGEFRARLTLPAREQRDLEVAKLRQKYAEEVASQESRVSRAEDKVEVQQGQYERSRASTMVSIGQTVLSALMGRKLTSSRNVSRAGTAVRGFSRTGEEKEDVERAKEALESERERLEAIDAELEAALAAIDSDFAPDSLALEPVEIKPRKGDLTIERFGIVWTPWRVDRDGVAEPLWRAVP